MSLFSQLWQQLLVTSRGSDARERLQIARRWECLYTIDRFLHAR